MAEPRINRLVNPLIDRFLVNAGLAAYVMAAEDLYIEGTPIAVIDEAMRASIFPMGPFELGDQAGLDIAAGMFDTIAAETKLAREPLVWKLRELKRFGIKTGAGKEQLPKDSKPGQLAKKTRKEWPEWTRNDTTASL